MHPTDVLSLLAECLDAAIHPQLAAHLPPEPFVFALKALILVVLGGTVVAVLAGAVWVAQNVHVGVGLSMGLAFLVVGGWLGSALASDVLKSGLQPLVIIAPLVIGGGLLRSTSNLLLVRAVYAAPLSVRWGLVGGCVASYAVGRTLSSQGTTGVAVFSLIAGSGLLIAFLFRITRGLPERPQVLILGVLAIVYSMLDPAVIASAALMPVPNTPDNGMAQLIALQAQSLGTLARLAGYWGAKLGFLLGMLSLVIPATVRMDDLSLAGLSVRIQGLLVGIAWPVLWLIAVVRS